eukprot:CAMPEP_0184453958 /NCGR_PEP_ID=MMETSP0740-20130409/18527_1 /TAXON_ID=385413 /ORGANISM="Thalassiosira miniscula, Strain CCMP1093" /LENGTH=35 /DNA_ID= /DNA_START= /DNA_END= /DNA_ORIENTATION=
MVQELQGGQASFHEDGIATFTLCQIRGGAADEGNS